MITSKDNPRVRRWAKLARDPRLRREERRAIIEGPHLVSQARPVALLVSESGTRDEEIQALLRGREAVVLADKVFRAIVEVESPQGIAAEIEIPRLAPGILSPAVFLEGVQDPGNVGAILRSAAAFGLRSAVLDRACADPWSPKVLRAAMGGHFSLHIHEVASLSQAVSAFQGKVICTVPRDGIPLSEANLDGPHGWLFGGEGEGVSTELQAKAAVRVTILMAPGAESLNVAAAAAICFYAGYRP